MLALVDPFFSAKQMAQSKQRDLQQNITSTEAKIQIVSFRL